MDKDKRVKEMPQKSIPRKELRTSVQTTYPYGLWCKASDPYISWNKATLQNQRASLLFTIREMMTMIIHATSTA